MVLVFRGSLEAPVGRVGRVMAAHLRVLVDREVLEVRVTELILQVREVLEVRVDRVADHNLADRAVLVDPEVLVVQVVLVRLVALVVLAALVDQVDLADRVALVVPEDLEVQVVVPEGLLVRADPADLVPVALVLPVDRAVLVVPEVREAQAVLVDQVAVPGVDLAEVVPGCLVLHLPRISLPAREFHGW